MKIPVKTDKFTIRQFNPDDAEDVIRNISSNKIYDNTYRIPRPFTHKHAEEYIAGIMRAYAKDDYTDLTFPESLLFAIEVGGEVVGEVGFKYVFGHKAEIVYWLADKCSGQGIMTEAAQLICDYGFDELGLDKIYAEIYIYNIGSQKVIEKLGFAKEGEMKKHLVKDGEFKDIFYYAKFG